MGLAAMPERYQRMIRDSKIGRPSKYNAHQTLYNGARYASMAEAKYAQELDIRLKVGEIKAWERQIPFDLMVGNKKVTRYVIDFVEIGLDGNKTYVEVKGVWTDVAKLKRKLFEALYPDLKYKVVK